VALGEALQDRGQHVAAGRRGGGERQRAALGVAQRAQLLLHVLQRVEHTLRVRGHDLAGLGEPAGAPVPLDEPVAHRRLEGLQVLGRRGLAHAAHVGGRGDRAAALDL
jgi:hypothetical protein